jgi:hypothetical protein
MDPEKDQPVDAQVEGELADDALDQVAGGLILGSATGLS